MPAKNSITIFTPLLTVVQQQTVFFQTSQRNITRYHGRDIMTKGTIFHRLLIGNRSWILTRSDITAAPAAAAAALSVRAHVPYHTQISFGYISLKLCRYVRRWVSDYPSPFKGLISTDLWTRCASRLSFEFDRLTSIGKFITVVLSKKQKFGVKKCFLPLNGVF